MTTEYNISYPKFYDYDYQPARIRAPRSTPELFDDQRWLKLDVVAFIHQARPIGRADFVCLMVEALEKSQRHATISLSLRRAVPGLAGRHTSRPTKDEAKDGTRGAGSRRSAGPGVPRLRLIRE
jgi:hypothetical protein